MNLTHEQCERARLARDSRFDGRFFTAVISTGIYCRPVCPAPPPRPENVRYFANAAAAAAAGFRPCLRCRPESAPLSPAWRGCETTVDRALTLIHDGEPGETLAGVCERLGVSQRHLRRLFQHHLGVSPLAYALNHRLLFAKQLLAESELSVLDIALACGFNSRRRFNDAFVGQFRLTPTRVRRGESGVGQGCTLTLSYRPPLDWSRMLAFLALRALPGVEVVEDDRYRRAFRWQQARGWFEVAPVSGRDALGLTLHCDSPRAIRPVVQRVRRVLDLDLDPLELTRHLSQDPLQAPLWLAQPACRLPGVWSEFEAVVRALVGQQISVKGARTILSRLCRRFGDPLQGPGLARLFPEPAALAGADLSGLGLTRPRAGWIAAIAQAYAEGFSAGEGDLVSRVNRLKTLKGVGDWTAHYVCMRAFGESDAFVATDLGLYHALGLTRGTAAQTLALAEPWRPWRAYGVMALWHSLGERA
ncbi:DNA-3-methyladenine glycosylase 2 family protein [Ferrimonas sediminicola]|uniref:DNA-3-methyladenine glycosylase II n=1 Tax=Ferrimonas sediminicola TaxID=2569538 RepID=A0A4U1BIP9_9GAMM|nr:AlkA N-terminal domain-containing protein [Ferrimonas sediminicola]TKB51249.1 DNA-3-methyladenine glycosylase 2 family protein [Ferrimonas sediminicola]